MARRGRPPRSDDLDGYVAWRRAEERAAEELGEGPAPAPLVAARGFLDVTTVWDWRRTEPTVRVWRAWLQERFGDDLAIAELIEAGELDDVRRPERVRPASEAMAAFHATMIPRLDADLTAIRGRRPESSELARLTGASVRTVKRHRAAFRPMDGPPASAASSPGDGNARSKGPAGE